MGIEGTGGEMAQAKCISLTGLRDLNRSLVLPTVTMHSPWIAQQMETLPAYASISLQSLLPHDSTLVRSEDPHKCC